MKSDFENYGINTCWNIIDFSSNADKKNKKKKTTFQFEKCNIIISNSQWLMLHGDELPYIDCIIQDEVHWSKKRGGNFKIS